MVAPLGPPGAKHQGVRTNRLTFRGQFHLPRINTRYGGLKFLHRHLIFSNVFISSHMGFDLIALVHSVSFRVLTEIY